MYDLIGDALQKESSFANWHLGLPMGREFLNLYPKGFAPLEALVWWRDYDPDAIDDEPFVDE
jgi:hypothetical protein